MQIYCVSLPRHFQGLCLLSVTRNILIYFHRRETNGSDPVQHTQVSGFAYWVAFL